MIFVSSAVHLFRWSPRPDSNRRPRPYQGRALPTELRGQMVEGGGFEPPKRRAQQIYSLSPLAARAPLLLSSGADDPIRTGNLVITNHLLYH